jgi:hypothetical protein
LGTAARKAVIGLALKLPAEGSPVSGSTRVLAVDLPRERADDVVQALRELVGRLPDHPAILPLTGVSIADGRPVVSTPPVTGDALDSALNLYGPAAVDDALPRVRQIAGALDLAAGEGLCHGALHPRDIIVSADHTWVAGLGVAGALARVGIVMPLDVRYTAPEVLASGTGTHTGDQYSLAVIAHEWMFSGAVTPADGFLAVPSVDGLNVTAMQRALDRATDTDPAMRFGNCLEFAAALERSAGREPMLEIYPAERLNEFPPGSDPGLTAPGASVFREQPVTPSGRQFGVTALVVSLIAGMAIGAVAIWLLGPSSADRTFDQSQMVTDEPMAQVAAPAEGPTEVVDPPVTPPRDDLFPAPSSTPVTTDAAPAAQADAGLLIHSTPAGAAVTVDGIPRGTTPVAVRGLALGTRRVEVSRPGYQPAERQVTLTAARPSRTLDVDLVAAARVSAPPVRPAAPATGSLVVESLPTGAEVSVDGQPAGRTPVTLTGLTPGRRTVRIERAGYRIVTTVVDVKAGERARVAARLEGGTNEE